MWTRFMDMHSGGGQKEDWAKIYIAAPEDEAIIIFYNRFGHSPKRVSCTCCGEDYSISEHENLAQLTGYDRNCRHLATPRYKSGKKKGQCKRVKDPMFDLHYYLEKGEDPPKGYEVNTDWLPCGEYQTLEEYVDRPDTLFIAASDIKPEERQGEVPEQGYVWV